MNNSNVKLIDYTLYKIDSNFNIVETDDNFKNITGYDINEENVNHFDLIPIPDKESYVEVLKEVFYKGKEAYIEHRLKRKDGNVIYVFCLGIQREDKVTKEIYTEIRVTNMNRSLSVKSTEKDIANRYKNRIDDLEHDDLTGLYRREPFIKRVNRLIRNKEKFSFILIDADDFKNVNDTYGHLTGDKVLIEIGNAFRKECDETYLCRMGGDEFALCFPKLTDKSQIENKITNIMDTIYDLDIVEDMKITISCGILVLNEINDDLTFSEIYDKSDGALYHSKEKGKNSYTFYKKNKK